MKKIALLTILIFSLILSGCIQKAGDTDDVGELGEGAQQSVDETADWQIYRNEEYGFEVKYPDEWRTAVCGIACQGFGPKNIPEDVVMGINVIDLSLSEAKEKLPVLSNKYNKVIKEEPVTMNQVNWIKLTIEQDISGDKTIFISHITELNGKTYEVGVGTDETDIVKIYSKILSTFKFINN